jgi:hypothetical protein
MEKDQIADTYLMLSLYILAAVIVPGILFLVYCFVSFSRAERRERKQQAAQSTGGPKQNHGREGMYKAVLATLALAIPATLAAQTTQALKETTATVELKSAEDFLVCGRCGELNVPLFLTIKNGRVKHDQDTSKTGHGIAVWL